MDVKVLGVINDDHVFRGIAAVGVGSISHVEAAVLKSLDLKTVAGERADLGVGNFNVRVRSEVPADDFDLVVGKREARVRNVVFRDRVVCGEEHRLHAEIAARDGDSVAAHVTRAFGGGKGELFARRRIGGFELEVSSLDDDGVAVCFLGCMVRGNKGLHRFCRQEVTLRKEKLISVFDRGARSSEEVEPRDVVSGESKSEDVAAVRTFGATAVGMFLRLVDPTVKVGDRREAVFRGGKGAGGEERARKEREFPEGRENEAERVRKKRAGRNVHVGSDVRGKKMSFREEDRSS